jgi:hypothetical protein
VIQACGVLAAQTVDIWWSNAWHDGCWQLPPMGSMEADHASPAGMNGWGPAGLHQPQQPPHAPIHDPMGPSGQIMAGPMMPGPMMPGPPPMMAGQPGQMIGIPSQHASMHGGQPMLAPMSCARHISTRERDSMCLRNLGVGVIGSRDISPWGALR